MNKYIDRYEAGKILAGLLKKYANRNDVIVLGLPRGGVPVAYEIAQALHAPLDVFIVRKLGVPFHEELALGALATGGITVFNDDIIRQLRITKAAINRVIAAEQEELTRREKAYRDNRPFPDLTSKTVIVVDDGIATGATLRAAIKALRELKPKAIVIAVPVAESSIIDKMAKLVDDIICPERPELFYAVGAWYEEFNQTTDEEVRKLLNPNKS